ncbi:MAG: amino acid ABC transporter permease [Lachnospiraceae bacterium]
MNYAQIWTSFTYALQFIPSTLILLFVPLFFGLVFGFIIAVIRVWEVPILARTLQVILTIFKGIPIYLLLVAANLLYVLYFDTFAEWLGISARISNTNIIHLANFLLTLCFLPGISELIRGGLISVNKGQYEAGYASGLTKIQTLRRVIIPQAIPEIIPGLTGTMLAMLKASALAYCVGVTDIMNAAVRVASNSYDFLEGYIAAAIIYWGLGIVIEKAMGLIAKKTERYNKKLAA